MRFAVERHDYFSLCLRCILFHENPARNAGVSVYLGWWEFGLDWFRSGKDTDKPPIGFQ